MAESPRIRVEAHTITARDQTLLTATLYRPMKPNDRAVLIAGAMGIKQGFYRHYARYLAEAGFVVLTFDYRGIGASRRGSLWGDEARLYQYGARDLQAMLAWLSRQYPAHELLIVGHSLGGQIAGIAPYVERVNAILGISARSTYWNHWPWPMKILMFMMWYLIVPLSTFAIGYFPASFFGLGDSLPRGVAFDWAAAARKRNYLLGAYGDTDYDNWAKFKGALRLFSFRDDRFAPCAAVQDLLKFYPNATVAQHIAFSPQEFDVPEIGHLGFFKLSMRTHLWERSLHWLQNPQAVAILDVEPQFSRHEIPQAT